MEKYKVVTQKMGQEILYNYGLGMSSKAILGMHLGVANRGYDYPFDSSDFMRCLGAVIAFDIDINIMKNSSYIWNRLIQRWDELVVLGLDGENKEINNILDEILNTAKTSFEIVNEVDCIVSINRAPEGCETKINLMKVNKKGKDE